MKNILWLFVCLLTLTIFFTGCKPANNSNDAENPAELKEQEVMEIHDIAMGKMGTINKYEVKLKEELPNHPADSVQIKQYLEDLSMAHHNMMDWMRNYKKPDGILPQQEVIEYLKQEKIKIEAVNTFTDKAIDQAKTFISSH